MSAGRQDTKWLDHERWPAHGQVIFKSVVGPVFLWLLTSFFWYLFLRLFLRFIVSAVVVFCWYISCQCSPPSVLCLLFFLLTLNFIIVFISVRRQIRFYKSWNWLCEAIAHRPGCFLLEQLTFLKHEIRFTIEMFYILKLQYAT